MVVRKNSLLRGETRRFGFCDGTSGQMIFFLPAWPAPVTFRRVESSTINQGLLGASRELGALGIACRRVVIFVCQALAGSPLPRFAGGRARCSHISLACFAKMLLQFFEKTIVQKYPKHGDSSQSTGFSVRPRCTASIPSIRNNNNNKCN